MVAEDVAGPLRLLDARGSQDAECAVDEVRHQGGIASGHRPGKLARALGLPDSAIPNLRRQSLVFEPATQPFDRAVLLIRIFQSLDLIAGGDNTIARAWIANPNAHLGCRPIDRIASRPGLIEVLAYLDARQARV